MATNNSINNETQELTVDPGASGDSFVQFDINGTGEFRIGVDDDASDAFKISQGSALGTNDTFVMTASGERTMPLQPAFLVTVASTISNVTGDGTAYTIVFDTEVYDQSGDMTTTTFTAPVTGRYMLNLLCSISDLSSGHTTGRPRFVTSNRTYSSALNPYTVRDKTNGISSHPYSMVTDMDSGDTVSISITVQSSTKTVDVYGSTYTFFSGSLAC